MLRKHSADKLDLQPAPRVMFKASSKSEKLAQESEKARQVII